MTQTGARSGPMGGRRSIVGVLLGAVLMLFFVAGTVASAEPSLRVITSPDRSGQSVDRKLLLSIYIGRVSTWPDGRPISVFTLPDAHPLHVQFCRQLLGTYPYVLRNAWDKLVYTGTGFTPTIVASEEEMRKRVENTPGAIGYLPAPGTGARLDPTTGSGEPPRQGVQQ